MYIDTSATFYDAGQIPLVCQDGMEGGGKGLSEKVDGRRVGPLPEPGLAGAALVEGLHLGQTSLRHRLNQVLIQKNVCNRLAIGATVNLRWCGSQKSVMQRCLRKNLGFFSIFFQNFPSPALGYMVVQKMASQ